MDKLEKLESKNMERAAGLVVRLQRAIERNTAAVVTVGTKMQEEQTRHIRAMDALRIEEKELNATIEELKREMAETQEYLKALTLESTK